MSPRPRGASTPAALPDLKAKVRIPDDDLRKAIDDYVEKLTGDRTTLHAPRHSIG
jgi:hypothetical protein